MTSLIETRALSKRYPGVLALDAVDFDLNPGEVHVLFGENGAGKSTLISMLAGANTPTSGEILREGVPVAFGSVADAQKAGVHTVFQEFSLVPTMTVAENIFLGHEPRIGPFINRAAMRRQARALFDDLDFPIDPDAPVAQLSRAQQQMVEIAKAFHGDLSILILDEPTASLTDREVDHLFRFIARLKEQGAGIIYISHRMQEFTRIADRITVLRDGARIGTVAMAETDEAALVEMMTGRSITEIYPTIRHAPGASILSVSNLRTPGTTGLDFEVYPGEVLGVAGLVGSGKSRAFRAVMGLAPRLGGTVHFKGEDMSAATPRAMIGAGAYYLSPDRKSEGLDLAATANANLTVNLVMGAPPGRLGLIDRRAARAGCTEIAGRVELSPDYRAKRISQLSGGNQQKVLFGKAFAQKVDLYIFDEPTIGVDMGTRAALYLLIRDLAEAGKAVVVISSDLPEAMNLSHRLLVFSNGRISAQLGGDDIREDRVLKSFFDEESQSA